VDTTDHNPGVRRYAVQALRVADGAPLGLFTDGEGSSVEAQRFSPRPGEATVVVTTDRSGVPKPVLWRITDDTRRPLATGDLPGDVIPIDWSSDGRYLLLCHLWRAAQQLLRYDLDTAGWSCWTPRPAATTTSGCAARTSGRKARCWRPPSRWLRR
jgi:hypothetical protein